MEGAESSSAPTLIPLLEDPTTRTVNDTHGIHPHRNETSADTYPPSAANHVVIPTNAPLEQYAPTDVFSAPSLPKLLSPSALLSDADFGPGTTVLATPHSHSTVWDATARCFRSVIPYGGLLSNCFTICSVTLGGAIIAMPHSFATSGMAMAVIYLVVVAVMTIYTMTLIGIVMEKTGGRTFEELGTILFGPRGGFFVGFTLWLAAVGTAVAYIGALRTLVRPILQRVAAEKSFWVTPAGDQLTTALLWLFLLIPVVVPKRVNSLRYVSGAAVLMVAYFVCTIVAHSCANGASLGMRDDMVYFTTGNKAIYGLSIFVFAYLSQAVAPPVYWESRPRPSVKALTYASVLAVTLCTAFYILAGVFGYLDFAGATEHSVLLNFNPVKQPYIMVAYVGMLVKISTAYAMNMIPCRNFVYHYLEWNIDTVPYWKHTAVVCSMSAIILFIGLFIPSMNLAFGLVGSICGGFIGFIFPALFWMYAGNWQLRTVGWYHYLATYALLVMGVIAIVFGTVATIHESFFSASIE